jgi:Abnormal spindle-like microcephaly-assoc'd, ASPM-SPD-2-Hydin
MFMPYRALLLLIPFLMLAEAPKAPSVPKKVDQALRQRASEFLQDQVAGNYRKALDLVAEDTQDYYLAAAKTKLFSFKIENIEYSDKFTKAKVDSSVRKAFPGAIPIEITVTQTDTWKTINGKWMWYHTPAESPLQELTGQAIPKDPNPAALAAAASKITAATSVDKQSLTFTLGSAGTEQVVFHNGNHGAVKLVTDVIGNAEEFQVEPITALVSADQDAKVKITYAPEKNLTMRTQVRLTVEPFQQQILIPITFASEP